MMIVLAMLKLLNANHHVFVMSAVKDYSLRELYAVFFVQDNSMDTGNVKISLS